MDQPRRHAAEYRVPLLALHVLLELDQAVGHRVERLAKRGELVRCVDLHARVELARGDLLGGALQRQNRPDERAAEQIDDGHHQGERE